MIKAIEVGLAASIPVALYTTWKTFNSPIDVKVFNDLSDPYWAYPFDRFIDYSVVSMISRARVISDAFFGEGWYGGGHWLPVPQVNGYYSPEVRSSNGVAPLLFICSENEKIVFQKHAALLFPELLNNKELVVDIDYCSLGEQLILLSLNEYHGFKLKFHGTWRFDTYYAPRNEIGNTYALKMPPETVDEPGVRPTKHVLNIFTQLEEASKASTADAGSAAPVEKGFQITSPVGGVSNATKVGAIAAGSLAVVAALYLVSPSLCEKYIEKNPSSKYNRLLELIANCPTFITTHTKSYGVLHTDRGPRLVGRQTLFSLLKNLKHYKLQGSDTLFNAEWRGGLREGAFISRNLSDGGVVIFDKLFADRCEATLITDGDQFPIVLEK